MKKIYLDNGIKLIYEKAQGDLTSFCIGFCAGADKDFRDTYGLAHVVEHMVYKGTLSKSEEEINKKIDEIFGFSNAMTNYPYVVFYGTCLNDDFEEGLNLHSDMLINPSFAENGFREEMDVIREELKEWSDDSYQHCEDLCLSHGFEKSRIKDLIIGSNETLGNITLKDIKKFHYDNYISNNCVISVVSSLEVDIVTDIVAKSLKDMRTKSCNQDEKECLKEEIYEENKPGIFKDNVRCGNCRINFLYSLHGLNEEEMINLKVFNNIFAEGVSSLLYNEIRTKRGLSYEVGSKIKEEKGIELYKIYLGTSIEKADVAVEVINNLISDIKQGSVIIEQPHIERAMKSIKLKQNIDLEKSIIRSFRLCIMELKVASLYYDEEMLRKINGKTIVEVVKKVFKKATIEIMT